MVTGKRGKYRKERYLASGCDRVARDGHHYGSSSFGCTSFYKVSREIVPEAMAITPHSLSPTYVFFFSVLPLAGQGGGWCLDTFSTTRYPSSNSLQNLFQVAVYSLCSLYFAGPSGG